MSPRSLVRTQAEGEKEGSITNAEFSAAVFYIMRKESLVDRDPKKVQSIKKFLEDTRKYAKLKESVDSGSMQMSDRWKKAEVFEGWRRRMRSSRSSASRSSRSRRRGCSPPAP